MASYDVGSGMTSAASGAATGAAIGSVVPGVGTAIGAGVGGLLGLLGGFKKNGNGQYEYVPPAFQNGSFSLNGSKLASVRKTGNTINTTMTETPEQQAQRQWRTNTIFNTEKTLGAPTDELLSRWTDLETGRKNRALAAYDEDVMSPALKAFKENSFSRWGGLGNSQSVIGFDKLLTDRDKQRANLAATYDENLFNLGNQEDTRLMNLSNFLQGNQSTQDSLLQQYLNNAYNASSLGNSQAIAAATGGLAGAQFGLQQDALKQADTNSQLAGLMSSLGMMTSALGNKTATPSTSSNSSAIMSALMNSGSGSNGSTVSKYIPDYSMAGFNFPRTTGATY